MSAQTGIPEGFEPIPAFAVSGDWEPLGGVPHYDDKVRAEALRQGFSSEKAELAVSLHRQEYDPNNFVSPAGAIGPMQLMPDTAKAEGVDPWDIDGNIRGGVSYFKKQLNKFGSPELALAAYNAGPEAVKKHGGVPPYAETRKHVRMSMDRWKRRLDNGKTSLDLPEGFEPLDIPEGFEPVDESEISQQLNAAPEGWDEHTPTISDEGIPLSIDNPNAPPYREPQGTWLSPSNEQKFQKWYGDWAKREDMNLNPDDPAHKYDYRAAFMAGVTPPTEAGGHWPSKFKADDHPNRFIPLLSGEVWDTKKDERVPAIRETPESRFVQNQMAGMKAVEDLDTPKPDPVGYDIGVAGYDFRQNQPAEAVRMPSLKEFSQQLLDAPLDTYSSFAKELNLSMESFAKKLSKISGLLEGEQLTDSRKKILEEMGLRKPESKEDEGVLNLDKVIQDAGIKGKEYFKELASEYRDNAKWWDEKIKNRDLATETITAAAGGAVPGIVEFTLGPVFSALEGYSEGGLTDAGKKALERVLLGKVLQASHPLSRPYRAGVMAAIGGAQAAEGGGEFRDIVKGAGSMGILGAMGGPGQIGLKEALQDFTRTSVLPLFERGELTYDEAVSELKKAIIKDFPGFEAKPDVLNRVAEWLIDGEEFTPETVRAAESSIAAMKVQQSSDEALKIAELHDYTVDNPGGAKKSVTIGKIEDAEASNLKDNTGIDGLEGYAHTIDNFSMRHILKTHGQSSTEASRGQAPITRDDLSRIPEIIQSPDKIENAGKSPLGLDTIKYTKTFNGEIYYLEEVRTGRKELATKTMWKTGAPRATSEEGVAHTSETFPGNNQNLSPDTESVKSDPKADPDAPLFSRPEKAGSLPMASFPPLPTVPGKELATIPSEASRSSMIKDIEESLNLPVRIGRFRQKAEGIFKPREGVVRLRRANDIEVAAHEAGHKIHMHELMIGLPKEMPDEVRSMAYEGAKDIDKEGFAEFFRVYVTQPDIAFERAPTFYEKFEGLLDQNHEISELVTRTRQAFQQYAAAPSVAKVMSFIRQTPPEAKRDWPQTMNDAYRNMVDELRPLQILKQIAEERGGRPIPVSED
ncbi:MAG: transglycosylase SLT domain-containing protein, partial [Syntrophobacter sp.]